MGKADSVGVLRIDTGRYGEAAGLAAASGRMIADAVAAAGSALSGTAGMAGWDALGVEWAAGYDPAAREVLAACQDIALASSDTSRALTMAAGNYITAEHVASMGAAILIAPLIRAGLPEIAPPCIPCASDGNPGWPPPCWDIIAGIAGVVWPAGDPELLRAAATAWTTLTHDIEASVAGPSSQARGALDGLLAEDLTLFRERSAAIEDSARLVAQASRDVATGCTSLADAVESAHQELIDETRSFALECAALAAAGTALSFVTLGGSAAISALIGAARTAQMVARVHQVLARLGLLARSVSVVSRRMPAAARLTAGLQALARTPTVLRSAVPGVRHALGAASGAMISSGRLSSLAPAVRLVRPVGASGLRIIDSKAVSVALSSPAALAREHLSAQVRRSMFPKAVPGGGSEQVLALLRHTRASPIIPAAESVLRNKDRAETVTGLVALPAALRDRYAPGRIEGPSPRSAGPGRLTAVQVSPASGPTASSSRARRTPRPAASP
jgi:hypothetical protein